MMAGTSLGAIKSGVAQFTMDWNYPPAQYNTSASSFLNQESFFNDDVAVDEDDEDDIDLYYMDLPPIDMTERLKEVNRALAEDATPVESNRAATIRFKEDIAEFQSPPDSDSDDGYGDSSEIMCDAEEENENENLLPLASSKEACMDLLLGTPSAGDSGGKKAATGCAFLPLSISSITPPQPPLPSPNIEPAVQFSKDGEQNSKRPTSPLITKLEFTIPKLDLEDSSKPDLGEDNLHRKENSSDANLNQSKSFYKATPASPSSEIESTGCEVEEEIEEDIIEVIPQVDEDTTIESNNKNNLGDSRERNKPSLPSNHSKPIVSIATSQNGSSKTTSTNYIANGISARVLSTASQPNMEECRDSESAKIKKKRDKSMIAETSERGRPKHRRPQYMSSSQPIPPIKAALLDPNKTPLGTSKDSSKSRSSFEVSRLSSKNKVKGSSPCITNSPLASPVQRTSVSKERQSTSRSHHYMSTKTTEKKPMKAIHSLNHFESGGPSSLRPQHDTQVFHSRNKLKKAASITDLRNCSNEHENTRESGYRAWLQQKNEKAATIKRQQEHMKASEEAAAKAKFEERKTKAEEAFQQWLKKKREQLRIEKKGRAQQRRLDQQSNYARTRAQCEEAYKEWCYRKREEMAVRRPSGASVRSRSLERTWIQEKTLKLYNAYVNK